MALTGAKLVKRILGLVGFETEGDVEKRQALDWLNDGYREFRKGIWYEAAAAGQVRDPRHHTFSFLKPIASLTFWEGFEEATISTSTTTLTSSTAIFHPTMLGATIVGDDTDTEYTIVTYTSTKIVVVDADASSDSTFTMTPNGIHRLPSDWGGSDQLPVYNNDAGTNVKLKEVTPEAMDILWRGSESEGVPHYWCYVPAAYAASAVPQQNMRVHPPPADDKTVNWQYRSLPADLTDADVYQVGGVEHDGTILAFAMAEAEFAKLQKHGPWWEKAMRLMRESVIFDTTLKDSSSPMSGTMRQE